MASQESGIAETPAAAHDNGGHPSEATIHKLKLWMRVVGALYILNAVILGLSFALPAFAESTVGARVPDAELSGPMYEFALDTWLMFGFEMLVVGAALLWASRDAWANRVLAGTVTALELVRGILDDLVWIARGYPIVPYIAWIVFHAVVAGTGILALSAARADART
ncbi:hypothetical protein BH23ACT4_BH23ACT4_07970 [soil metagenome]